ncbi:hypothetical protein P9112_009332 [Eukaryota sp. TZLM1-RC]
MNPLRHVLLTLIGHKVTVKTTDRKTYSGFLGSIHPLDQQKTITLTCVQGASISSSFDQRHTISFTNISSITAESISTNQFATDEQIAQFSYGTERELTPWQPDTDLDPDLEASKVFDVKQARGWNQFAANKIQNTYREENYTTRIDRQNPNYTKWAKEAAVVEKDMKQTETKKRKFHRSQPSNPDNDLDEEVKFSAARPISNPNPNPNSRSRTSSPLNPNARRSPTPVPKEGAFASYWPRVLEKNNQIPGIMSAPTSPHLPDKELPRTKSGNQKPGFTPEEYTVLRKDSVGSRRNSVIASQIEALNCSVVNPQLPDDTKVEFDKFKKSRQAERQQKIIDELKSFHKNFRVPVSFKKSGSTRGSNQVNRSADLLSGREFRNRSNSSPGLIPMSFGEKRSSQLKHSEKGSREEGGVRVAKNFSIRKALLARMNVV